MSCCVFRKLPLVLLAACVFGPLQARAVVLTTTDFGPPTMFGAVSDGAIFPGSPYAGRTVVEVRLYWDVVVPEGHDAATINAGASLPILTLGKEEPGHLPSFNLDGPHLGWSGAGTFHHAETVTASNLSFGPHWTWFTSSALGLPFDTEVLATSRIEIDYIATQAGDTNGDGLIDNGDLATAISNFTGPQTDPRTHRKVVSQGDTDGDGAVGNDDLAMAISGFTGPGPAPVPEPASLALLALGGLIAGQRRRQA